MNVNMNWLARQVPTEQRDDWSRGGGSWGQTLPAPVPETSAKPAAVRLDRLVRPVRQDPGQLMDAALQPVTPDRTAADWEHTIGVCRARLADIAAASLPLAADVARPGRLHELRLDVLECASLLDQLHGTLAQEVERRRSLEFEASNARAALAMVRAQLLGARGLVVPNRPASSTDELTGLADRDSLGERLRQMTSGQGRSRPALAMLVLDLDGFAAINEAHGCETGDALLRIVAARLVRALRCDDLVSRLGGDEFACLLANVPSRDMLTHLACKLFDSVAAPVRIGPLQLTVRPSIGIATCPDDGEDASALVTSARAADRRARQQGSGYAFYDRPIAPPSAHPGASATS